MRQITFLSGKGGTGKTTVTAALAVAAAEAEKLVVVDADVDAANLALLLHPEPEEAFSFPGGEVAVLDASRCELCGQCAAACRFDAIHAAPASPPTIDPVRCEGCGACLDDCPGRALSLVRSRGGTWWRSRIQGGTMFHAELDPGGDNSGQLVTRLRQAAKAHAKKNVSDLVLIDGPPGIGCATIAAVTGVDLAVVVTEATPSGLHDLDRILGLLQHFEVPAVVCVNRADLGKARAQEIEARSQELGLGPVVRIPFDPEVVAAVRAGRPLVVGQGGAAAAALEELQLRVDEALAAMA